VKIGQEKIIVFDGECNLCNRWVKFVLKHDLEHKFKFCALQSKTGKKISANFLKGSTELKTIIFINGNHMYVQSTAALYIFRHLTGIWRFMYVFVSIPKFIRDFFYNIISKNRYKWFGKAKTCYVPSKENKSRFLD